jgi:hypothetical protein
MVIFLKSTLNSVSFDTHHVHIVEIFLTLIYCTVVHDPEFCDLSDKGPFCLLFSLFFFMKHNLYPPDFWPSSNIDPLYCTVQCTV